MLDSQQNNMLENAEAECSWVSAYVYFQGGVYTKVCDYVVLEVIEPFVHQCFRQGWIARYFFIRYSERGSHVRLRFYGKSHLLEQAVKPAFHQHIEEVFPSELYATPRLDPESNGASTKPSPLHWIAYEPETSRYGGTAGVALAERFFYYSSNAAFALLKQIAGAGRSVRLGKGLLAMLVLLYVFRGDREQAAVLCHRYATNYLRNITSAEEQRRAWLKTFGEGYTRQTEALAIYINTAWDQLAASKFLTTTLNPYRQNLLEVHERFTALQKDKKLHKNGVILDNKEQAVSVIVPSYLHMMNNRLGISPAEESYLAYLITKVLRAFKESCSV